MTTWLVTFHSGAKRTIKAETWGDVVNRLESEAKLVKKSYKSLGVFSIVKLAA